MKKSLFIAGLATALMMSASLSYAATTNTTDVKPQQKYEKKFQQKDCKCKKDIKNRKPNLDERLNLTEEQKQKAHDLRMDGHKKMKPVFDKIAAKKAEIKKVEESNISQDKKDKKIQSLKNDIKTLRQEAKKIRIDNAKQFEAILTPEQKTEFEKIKQEGREKAKGHHKMKKQDFPDKKEMTAPKK